MKGGKSGVLIFVEDPGAANYVAPLPAALAARGVDTAVWSAGIATDYLAKRGVRTRAAEPFVRADQILDAVRPQVLVVGTAENPETLGLALIATARSEGIPSVAVVDAAMNAGLRFRGQSAAPLTYAPDWLLVPDEWTKRAFVALGFPDGRAVVSGHPHYDYVLDMAERLSEEERALLQQRVLGGVSAEQKVVVFVAEGSARLKRVSRKPPTYEHTLAGRGTACGRTEIVLEEFLDAVKSVSPRPYLVFRPHPKDTPDDYAAYLEEFDRMDSESAPLDLVASADLVVGSTSMLLLEAALLGRPTLSILPCVEEKEWLPSIRAGATACVITREELESILPGLLREGWTPRRADHQFVVRGALRRVVTFLDGLLKPGEK